MNTSLLLLDSRERFNPSVDQSYSKFRLTPAINNVRRVELLSFDLPIPEDANDEGVFYLSIDEFGQHVRGVSELSSGSFVLFRETEAGARTPIYNNITFHQSFEINDRSISELNCRITYRNSSNELLTLGADWNCLLKLN